MPPNWVNRTLWTGDNLDILRGMNSECVDLIYLDPPFNSNRDYEAPIGSKAAGAMFKDTWTLSDLDVAWMGLIADEQPAIAYLLDAAGRAHGKGMQSYLTMMAVRLVEMHRLLTRVGSLYLHCDPTAGAYLRMLLDAIFGRQRFRNEIIWERTLPKGLMTRRLPTSHDVLISYQKSDAATWNTEAAFLPYDESRLDEKTKKQYSRRDADGRRYQLTSLLNPNRDRPNLTYEFLGVTKVWRWTKGRMQEAYDRGLVVQPSPGKTPRYKRYLDEQRGRPLSDVWTDIPPVSGTERIDYPTQKPLALLERIIETSTNEGDVVLDPFCGCATACVAAERLNRQWVGIDISPKAVELVQYRLKRQESRGKHRTSEPGEVDALQASRITARTDIPRRTDVDAPKNYRENKHILYGQQEGRCGGCRTHFEFRHFDVDHKVPQSKGGGDHIENLQLLCASCNRIKGDRPQEYLVARLAELAG